jgi:hypothetical protein
VSRVRRKRSLGRVRPSFKKNLCFLLLKLAKKSKKKRDFDPLCADFCRFVCKNAPFDAKKTPEKRRFSVVLFWRKKRENVRKLMVLDEINGPRTPNLAMDAVLGRKMREKRAERGRFDSEGRYVKKKKKKS